MGAGVSQKTMNGYYYRALKKIQRELQAAGVYSEYKSFGLHYVGEDRGFGYSYRTIRASNGETAGIPSVWIRYQGKTEEFNDLSDAGIKRIKEVFGTKV